MSQRMNAIWCSAQRQSQALFSGGDQGPSLGDRVDRLVEALLVVGVETLLEQEVGGAVTPSVLPVAGDHPVQEAVELLEAALVGPDRGEKPVELGPGERVGPLDAPQTPVREVEPVLCRLEVSMDPLGVDLVGGGPGEGLELPVTAGCPGADAVGDDDSEPRQLQGLPGVAQHRLARLIDQLVGQEGVAEAVPGGLDEPTTLPDRGLQELDELPQDLLLALLRVETRKGFGSAGHGFSGPLAGGRRSVFAVPARTLHDVVEQEAQEKVTGQIAASYGTQERLHEPCFPLVEICHRLHP